MTSDRPGSFTPQQQAAIRAKGDVLVIAGAGTGKTRTLVESCVEQLLNGNCSLDRILMVTFTEAAAAEMRQRIRDRLESALDQDRTNPRIAEQLALLDSAMIRTLHSFCYELIREHFYMLQLDPRVTVLTEQQTYVLQEEAFDALFTDVYRVDEFKDARALIRLLGFGRDHAIRKLIRSIHIHTQTRPDPDRWFVREQARFENPDPKQWKDWLLEGADHLDHMWLERIRAQAHRSPLIGELAETVSALVRCSSEKQLRGCLDRILEIRDGEWDGQKTELAKPLERFFKDAKFLHTLVANEKTDPLLEDWQWQAPSCRTLLRISQLFATRYSDLKTAHAVIDFNDLEQQTLRLLWEGDSPSPVAGELQQRFQRVFVDEYQDINPAQDRILCALAGTRRNRFLVGDVKQSIYRFRQAAPEIFQGYANAWNKEGSSGQTLLLSENFRSRESILDFINGLFGALMTSEFGGLDYAQDGQLTLGNRSTRKHLAREQDVEPRVEVLISLNPGRSDDEADDRTNQEREARGIALRLQELKRTIKIWDDRIQQERPPQWRDMVVLLRATTGKVESYAKEFNKAGVPLLASGLGLFESLEVNDLRNILLLLDNPLQDRPLLAVLRSPLVGLSADELAEIRLAQKKCRYWVALERWHTAASKKSRTPAFEKIDLFLERFRRWRSTGRFTSLVQRLEQVLDETYYLDWLTTQTRPTQRLANIQELIGLARQFDQLHGQSLYQFLRFIDAEEATGPGPEPPPGGGEDAVRLMTIHKSKGLEFPIVVVPDLGKQFNTTDFNNEILLDDELGLCAKVHPPESGQSYPSLSFWLARKKQETQMRAEELRLLYVAMTRAREWLVLSGNCSESELSKWADHAPELEDRAAHAIRPLHWIIPWLSRSGGQNWITQPQGGCSTWTWRIYRTLPEEDGPEKRAGERFVPEFDVNEVIERLRWIYPNVEATVQSAKSSVTVLRREAADEEEVQVLAVQRPRIPNPAAAKEALEGGVANHTFLQWATLEAMNSEAAIREEATRLVSAALLSPQQSTLVNIDAIARFWSSSKGREILQKKDAVRRELPFTLRLDAASAKELIVGNPIPPGEFIIVQGVVDVAVILPEEIWILDFKTDQVEGREVTERAAEYALQLRLYAKAMEEIFGRKVTRLWLHFLKPNRTIEMR